MEFPVDISTDKKEGQSKDKKINCIYRLPCQMWPRMLKYLPSKVQNRMGENIEKKLMLLL